MTGSFSGQVNFNPNGSAVNLTSLGSNDAFVAMYNSNNSLVWVERMGGNMVSQGNKLAVDGSGNVYVAGQFSGSNADFGSTLLNSVGGKDGFVTKLNSSGQFQWAESWGTPTNDFATGVGVDSAGNVYTDGFTLAASGESGVGYTVLKYSPNGALAWSDSISANSVATKGGLAVDPSGDVYVGGSFLGTANFNPSGRAHNVSSGCGGTTIAGFVLQLNTNGKFDWVSPFEGQTVGSTKGYSEVYGLALDGSGKIDVGGIYSNTVNFNPGHGVTELPPLGQAGQGFIVQLNSSGGLNWAAATNRTTANTSGYEEVWALGTDSSGNVYVSGIGTGGTVTSSNGSQTPVAAGLFVVEFNSVGNFVWDAAYSYTGTAIPDGVAVDPSGNVYIAGLYNGTLNFPEPLTSNGGSDDIFLLQLNQSDAQQT